MILAAGQGTRMQSALPKVLHPIGGKPMVEHVVDAASSVGDAIHVVVGHGAEQVQEHLGERCSFVVQKQQLGTGHAVDQAAGLISAGGTTLILYGDVPLIRSETLSVLLAAANDQTLALLTAFLPDPTGYGRIVRDAGERVVAIVEQKDASSEQLAINEINTGIMAVPTDKLLQWLPQLSNDNAQEEYYLTDVIAMAANDGVEVVALQPQSLAETEGVNDRVQLAALEREYQLQRARELMLAGATLADPSRVDVRGNVNCGRDVFIDINVVFEGDVTLGDNARIGPGAVIRDASIGAGSVIHEHCVIESASMGKACSIGPFARLRPAAQLADKVKVGNFVEVKNTTMAEGAKANHLAYVGDAVVGAGTNIGAGTITCNYDGANKHRTELGDNVFIGSNSTLVAPLQIASGAFVGAGSTVTKPVPEDDLAIGRARQRNISGWEKPTKNK